MKKKTSIILSTVFGTVGLAAATVVPAVVFTQKKAPADTNTNPNYTIALEADFNHELSSYADGVQVVYLDSRTFDKFDIYAEKSITDSTDGSHYVLALIDENNNQVGQTITLGSAHVATYDSGVLENDFHKEYDLAFHLANQI